MTNQPIINPVELVELRNQILAILDGKDPRICGAVLCDAVAAVGFTVGMPKATVMLAAMTSINDAWAQMEERFQQPPPRKTDGKET